MVSLIFYFWVCWILKFSFLMRPNPLHILQTSLSPWLLSKYPFPEQMGQNIIRYLSGVKLTATFVCLPFMQYLGSLRLSTTISSVCQEQDISTLAWHVVKNILSNAIKWSKLQSKKLNAMMLKLPLSIIPKPAQGSSSKEVWRAMESLHAVVTLEDQGGRRSGPDRRSFFTPECILERRSAQDRRSGLDRRIRKEDFTNLMVCLKPKRKTDVYIEALRIRRMLFFNAPLGLLMWAIIISIARIF